MKRMAVLVIAAVLAAGAIASPAAAVLRPEGSPVSAVLGPENSPVGALMGGNGHGKGGDPVCIVMPESPPCV